MFKPIKEENIKEIEQPIEFKFINVGRKALTLEGYKKIFKQKSVDNKWLSEINSWLRYYSMDEIEALCETVYEYRNYYKRDWSKLYYFRAIRFLICIQAGLSRFDAYIDAHHQNKLVKEYLENKDKDIKKKIMNLAASYSNYNIVIQLAQALDAPIQISYQGYKHQMVEVLRDIAVNGKSERERANAANSLLQHLNPNQMSTLQINIGRDKKEVTFIDQAQEALKLLASKKLADIREGTKAEDIINVDIIEETNKIMKQEIEEMNEEEQRLYEQFQKEMEGKEND